MKTTKQDDLSVNDFVLIVDTAEYDQPEEPQYGIFGYGQSRPRRNRERWVDGLPLKILAISLPFAVVNDGKSTYPIDLREHTFVRVSEEYVKAMEQALKEHAKKNQITYSNVWGIGNPEMGKQ